MKTEPGETRPDEEAADEADVVDDSSDPADSDPSESDAGAATDADSEPVPGTDTVDDADDRDDEPFTRYQNSVYRLISMGGAALVAIIGITLFAIARTLDPVPPAPFFFIDAILTVLLFGWYVLGLRCRLDVAETWVHIATKYGDFRIDRDRVVSVEPDRSLRGTLQFSGRPLIVRYRPPDDDDAEDGKVKSRRAYGCLPNDAQTQAVVVEELQELLGKPDDDAVDLSAAVADRLAGGDAEAEEGDVAAAVAARLASMEPEGDDPGR